MTMMVRKAILDGDILAYRAAFWADVEGEEYLEGRLKDDLKRWTPPDVDEIEIALSCKRSDNFRRDWLPDYKAHRDGKPSPESLPLALEILPMLAPVVRQDRMEADDLMGIEKSALRAICVTIDKDLKQVPGYGWYPQIDPEIAITEVFYTELADADFQFHKQWIMGDTTDNVGGIWKLGEKKAEALLRATSPKNHTALVLSLYETRKNKEGGAYSLDDAIAMGRAVRICRDGELAQYDWYSSAWCDEVG